MNTSYNITSTGRIAAFINGKMLSIDTDHVNYNKCIQALKDEDYEAFYKMVDISTEIEDFSDGEFEVKGGEIFYQNFKVENYLTKKILQFMRDGLPYKPLISFLKNLMLNPSYRAVQELYQFLEIGDLPITDDGHFLAFKNVRSNFKDIHSGTFDNSVGQTVTMPRNMVDEDSNQTCSKGLHFCSIAYLPHFTDCGGGKTVVLKINPADVVSIPKDYNNTKGRCCKYEVVSEYTENWREKIDRNENGFDSPVYFYGDDEDQEEYYDDDEDCDCDCCCDDDDEDIS